MMGDIREAVESALDGPDVTSAYECAHCGEGVDNWSADCPRCGGAVGRIVLDHRDDEAGVGWDGA